MGAILNDLDGHEGYPLGPAPRGRHAGPAAQPVSPGTCPHATAGGQEQAATNPPRPGRRRPERMGTRPCPPAPRARHPRPGAALAARHAAHPRQPRGATATRHSQGAATPRCRAYGHRTTTRAPPVGRQPLSRRPVLQREYPAAALASVSSHGRLAQGLTPSERVLQTRMAADISWAKTDDRSARTAPPIRRRRLASRNRSTRSAGPAPRSAIVEPSTPCGHMTRLALRSAQVRRRRPAS